MKEPKTEIYHNGNGYLVKYFRYSKNKYIQNEGEETEHILIFGPKTFKGKTLEDVINEFKRFLEDAKF